ncbi:MAG: hypothetical protein ABIM20_03645 [candidate division WOR-3 bacterium]
MAEDGRVMGPWGIVCAPKAGLKKLMKTEFHVVVKNVHIATLGF